MLIAGELERAGRGPEGLGVEPAFLDRVADSTGGAQPVGEPERALPKSSIGLDRQGRGLTEAAGGGEARGRGARANRSEEHTSELQSLMRISYAVFCLKKKKHTTL